ncbi:DUF3109 family protein [Lewinella cohaerens]|uniref:DUF3109 family protein n=1 Tax=Lewinella cohaerens TaxID=70995 RepID=UPI000373FB80|nr:DUF3109 family protein [Lewinella cohaerens]
MIIIQDKIVSDELVEEQFLCNLDACKGACCWEGDAGAPLEEEELALLKETYPTVSSYLSPAGRAAIASQGLYLIDEEDGEYRTPLIDDAPCAYMTLDNTGKAQCGIEQAWQAGDISFRKPISCHLYPIRITKNSSTNFEALNYDRWDICTAACTKGKAAKLPVYRFAKEALIRKYGAEFYDELDQYAKHTLTEKE